jgi:hypothetical protein
LQEVTLTIERLLAAQEVGQPIQPSLIKALEEQKKLRSWIASHEHRKT